MEVLEGMLARRRKVFTSCVNWAEISEAGGVGGTFSTLRFFDRQWRSGVRAPLDDGGVIGMSAAKSLMRG